MYQGSNGILTYYFSRLSSNNLNRFFHSWYANFVGKIGISEIERMMVLENILEIVKLTLSYEEQFFLWHQ